MCEGPRSPQTVEALGKERLLTGKPCGPSSTLSSPADPPIRPRLSWILTLHPGLLETTALLFTSLCTGPTCHSQGCFETHGN